MACACTCRTASAMQRRAKALKELPLHFQYTSVRQW